MELDPTDNYDENSDLGSITEEEVKEFGQGMEVADPLDVLRFEEFAEALGDFSQDLSDAAARRTGSASPEEIARATELLQPPDPSEHEGKVAKYPPDPTSSQ